MCVLHLNKLHDIRCIHIYFYSPPIYILSRRYMMCIYIYTYIHINALLYIYLPTYSGSNSIYICYISLICTPSAFRPNSGIHAPVNFLA